MKPIIRSKKPNLYFISKSLIKLVDAITPILTIGFYWTDLEYRFTKWYEFNKNQISGVIIDITIFALILITGICVIAFI